MNILLILYHTTSHFRIKPCFEQIKRNLDHGRYNRLDKFQENMFEVFEYARCVSRTDSQVSRNLLHCLVFYVNLTLFV